MVRAVSDTLSSPGMSPAFKSFLKGLLEKNKDKRCLHAPRRPTNCHNFPPRKRTARYLLPLATVIPHMQQAGLARPG